MMPGCVAEPDGVSGTGYGTRPSTSRRRGAVRFLPVGKAGRSESKYCLPSPGTGPPPLVVVLHVQHEPR